MLTRKLTGLTVGASLLLGLVAPAQASFITDNLTSGIQNDFEDQSREAYFDGNADGLFGVGDILTGFIKLDNKSAPNAVDLQNTTYAIFSQEIKSVSGGQAQFGPVAAGNGLNLVELGVPGAGVNDAVALFSTATTPGFSIDLITASPGNRVGGPTVTLADYFDLILSEGGTPDLIAGLVDAPLCGGGDCFQATGAIAQNIPNSQLIGAGSGLTFGNFVGGLEITLNPAGWVLLDAVAAGLFAPGIPPVAPPIPLTTTAGLAISNGAARGTAGSAFESEWIDGSELSALGQCTDQAGANTICGFINDADFSVFPVRVPEPSIIALLGFGLLGIGATRRKRRS